jgi:glyoxylase-like metal-dependent hydrolase (beta-lactamase superfamily II)
MLVFERGWLSANNILFTAGDQTVLVDTGYCTHAKQTVSLVESALGSRHLDIVANTHLHSDHCGGNAALQERYPGLQTLIPPGQAALVDEWDAQALTYLPTGQQCPRFGFTETLKPGQSIRFGKRDWQVHAAAGHDPHSVIFFEPVKKILISADALWQNGFGVVFPELEGKDAFGQVGETLDVIEGLGAEIVVPGHGAVFVYSDAVMHRARQRLESFASNPRRHARHAAKVLLKFKLLEVHRLEYKAFLQWALVTPYFQKIDRQFFEGTALPDWLQALIAELIAAGNAGMDGVFIVNA